MRAGRTSEKARAQSCASETRGHASQISCAGVASVAYAAPTPLMASGPCNEPLTIAPAVAARG
eukprot:scaffold119615_cov63-Phaeocystis_antarctica.AAC.3